MLEGERTLSSSMLLSILYTGRWDETNTRLEKLRKTREKQLNANESMHSIDLKVVLPDHCLNHFMCCLRRLLENLHTGKDSSQKAIMPYPLGCITTTLNMGLRKNIVHVIMSLCSPIKRHKTVFVTLLRCRRHVIHHSVRMSLFTHHRVFNKV